MRVVVMLCHLPAAHIGCESSDGVIEKSIQPAAALSLTCLYAPTVIIFEIRLKQQITHIVFKEQQ